MANIILLFIAFFHPFYVSVTDIKHNSKSKSLEISTKIFFDDLEKAIEMKSNRSIDIVKPVDKAEINRLIEDYLKKHLSIKVNGKIYPFAYLGYEIQEDAAWCYLEVIKVNHIKTIEVSSKILYDQHQEQINILNVTVDGRRKSTKLDNPESIAKFSF